MLNGPVSPLSVTFVFLLAIAPDLNLCYWLVGFMYVSGIVIEKDITLAFKYLKAAYFAEGQSHIRNRLDSFGTMLADEDQMAFWLVIRLIENPETYAPMVTQVIKKVTSKKAISKKATSFESKKA